MSLPSQTARSSPAGRTFVYRKRRGRRGIGPMLIVGGGALFILLLIGWMFVFGPWSGKAQVVSDEQPSDTESLAQGDRQNTGPVVINQGSANNERERFAAPALAPERIDDVTIPDLVPPPLEESRGMLDDIIDPSENGGAPIVPQAEDRPAEPNRAGLSSRDDNPISAHLEAADALLDRNDPLAARQALWDAMRMPGLDERRLGVLRDRLTKLNMDLVFGPVHRAGDPLSRLYTVKRGDSLSQIARREKLGTHWGLIQRINGLSSPERIREGQKLKLVAGTFHAVVDKSDFRLDLYHGETEEPDSWVFIASFDVGLGEGDSTPIGQFVVRDDGKLANPGWVNPRNPADKFGPDDPGNPIGEFWVGLDGLGDSAAYVGYGLHGTIDPNSIGLERSMGCVRLRPDAISLVYGVMTEGRSLVNIRR